MKSFFFHLCALTYRMRSKLLDRHATQYFRSECRLVSGTAKHPCHVTGEKKISINNGFYAGPGLRLEAVTRHRKIPYTPEIIIGQQVAVGSHCHITAMNSITIEDDVLIGSHVLITDHQHEKASLDEIGVLLGARTLYSKGPVIIKQQVWIGDNVCVMLGVTIGENSVVGSNSVVTKDLPPNSICAGVSAKFLKQIE